MLKLRADERGRVEDVREPMDEYNARDLLVFYSPHSLIQCLLYWLPDMLDSLEINFLIHCVALARSSARSLSISPSIVALLICIRQPDLIHEVGALLEA